jgi:hypothetical protein
MNLNGQIDWSDTDRIVSNDTRYISLGLRGSDRPRLAILPRFYFMR